MAEVTKLADTTANPAPLGLMGFGMTTVLLNIHNAGFYPLDTMILAMGIFYGGIAQIIAGILESKKGNTFATTAFISYGSFWLTLVALILLPKMGFVGIEGPVKETAFAAYLAMWGLFTLVLFFGTLRLNRALQVVFGSLVILYALLVAANMTGSKAILTFAGWEGLFCGFSAIYAGLAQVLNEVYGKIVWPLGPVQK